MKIDWKTISSFLGLVAVVMGASYYFWDLDHKTTFIEEKLAVIRSDLDNMKKLNQGPPGVKGERGPAGPRGEKGERGEKGSPGDPADIAAIRRLIVEEFVKKEHLERIKQQIVKILNEDADVQVKYKHVIWSKDVDLDLKQGQAKMVFGNKVSVGASSLYNGYAYIRVATDVEQKNAKMYPGTPWVLKGSDGKFGIALISSNYSICKLKVYKIDDYKKNN